MKDIDFPPTKKVILTSEQIDNLRKQGLEIRAEIEKQSRKMFVPPNSKRFGEEMGILKEILIKLGEPNKIGNSQTWIARDYSKRDLILDLQKLKISLEDDGK